MPTPASETSVVARQTSALSRVAGLSDTGKWAARVSPAGGLAEAIRAAGLSSAGGLADAMNRAAGLSQQLTMAGRRNGLPKQYTRPIGLADAMNTAARLSPAGGLAEAINRAAGLSDRLTTIDNPDWWRVTDPPGFREAEVDALGRLLIPDSSGTAGSLDAEALIGLWRKRAVAVSAVTGFFFLVLLLPPEISAKVLTYYGIYQGARWIGERALHPDNR